MTSLIPRLYTAPDCKTIGLMSNESLLQASTQSLEADGEDLSIDYDSL